MSFMHGPLAERLFTNRVKDTGVILKNRARGTDCVADTCTNSGVSNDMIFTILMVWNGSL